MASPQVEHGHFKFANELAEALAKTHFTSYQQRILWAVWRQTYGWHKKFDRISLSQFEKLTGMKKSHICRTKKELKERNIITISGNKIGFQKDYTRWRALPNQVTVTNPGKTITSNGNKSLPELGPTKDNIKDTISKYNVDFEKFWKAYPNKVGKSYAFKCWKRIKHRPKIEVLLQAIEIQKDSEKWQKGYIPNPSTWLNQGRWEDEIGKQDNNRGYAERLFGPRHEKD